MRDNIKLAFRSIRANKMRSMLTMLGIIIGIAAVIAIMTIARSMNLAMEAQNAAMGMNNLSVGIRTAETAASSDILSVPAASSKSNNTDPYRYTAGYPNDALIPLDVMRDFQEKFADRIAGISYTWDVGSGHVTLEHNTVNCDLNSANANYLDVSDFGKIELVAGRWIRLEDSIETKKIAVIPLKLANALFDDTQSALGKQIDVTLDDPIKTITVTVVGVYKSATITAGNALTGSFTFDPSEWGDPVVYLPIATGLDVNSVNGIVSFSIAGVAGVDFDKFKSDIQDFFNSNYRYEGYEVEVSTPNDYGLDDDTTMQTLENAFSVVAAISLLVGGIGVMNIMTVSVTERTREIGVRKALGAKRGNIRMQFITESVVLSLFGGILGVILGIVLGNVAASMMGYPATASPGSVFVSFGVSVAIGVFFGYYPANKAAKMNPIDALRYE